MKRCFQAAGLATFVCLALSVSVSAKVENPKVSARPPGQYGGTLTVAVTSDPKTFNIITATETSSTDALGFVFDGLMEVNGVTTEVEPALAERWVPSKDGLVWTFYLRKGVQWHDGAPFTADDVIFTFDVIYDPKVPNSMRDTFTIDGQPIKYEKIDAYTVRFTLPKPFAPMLRQLTTPIIPKHILEPVWKVGKFAEAWGIDTDPRRIVGTGPFQMVSYRPGQAIIFVRNSNYWKVDAKGKLLPYITRLNYLIVPDRETQSLKFRRGETDGISIKPAEYPQYKAGEKMGNYSVKDAGPTFSTNFVVFNQNPNLTRRPKLDWFTNVKFRQAAAYAIDKKSIIDSVYGGLAYPQWSPVSQPNRFFLNERVKTYPYSLKQAAAALAEGGFEKGPDDLLRDAKGNVVEFNLFTNSNTAERVAIGKLLKEDLEKLGMKVNFQPLDFNLLVEMLTTPKEWDAIIIGLTGGVDPHSSRNVWHSSGQLHMWWPRQDSPATAWETRVNELFDRGATTVDPVLRKRIYDEWQKIISEQVPLIYTVASSSIFAVRNTLRNVEPTAFGNYMHNIYEIWVTKR